MSPHDDGYPRRPDCDVGANLAEFFVLDFPSAQYNCSVILQYIYIILQYNYCSISLSFKLYLYNIQLDKSLIYKGNHQGLRWHAACCIFRISRHQYENIRHGRNQADDNDS